MTITTIQVVYCHCDLHCEATCYSQLLANTVSLAFAMLSICLDRRTPFLVSGFTDLWRNASVLRYTFCQHPTADVLARGNALKFPHSIDALPNEVRTQLAQKQLDSLKEFLQRLESRVPDAVGPSAPAPIMQTTNQPS